MFQNTTASIIVDGIREYFDHPFVWVDVFGSDDSIEIDWFTLENDTGHVSIKFNPDIEIDPQIIIDDVCDGILNQVIQNES